MVKKNEKALVKPRASNDLCKDDMYVARNLAKIRKAAGVSRAAKGSARAIYKDILEMGMIPEVIIASAERVRGEKKRTVKMSHFYAAFREKGATEYAPEEETSAIVVAKKKPTKDKSKKKQIEVPEDNSDSEDESM